MERPWPRFAVLAEPTRRLEVHRLQAFDRWLEPYRRLWDGHPGVLAAHRDAAA